MQRTEILFAPWAVKALKNTRGARWRRLVDHVGALSEEDPDALAFQLMMIRLNSCLTCNARRYAERGGCANCSATNLGFCKDTDEGLLARFRAARKEIGQALKLQAARGRAA